MGNSFSVQINKGLHEDKALEIASLLEQACPKPAG
jgi:hypothetical protein